MILLDNSVLIAHLRTRKTDRKLSGLFTALPVQVCGVARTEVIAGAKSPADRVQLGIFLDSFVQLPTPETMWDDLGDHLVAFRRAGLTVPLPDAILATMAIGAGCELWTRDAHFQMIQQVLPALHLFAEPP